MFKVNRGLKTLHVRMPRHAENATTCAIWLESCDRIANVTFPGLKGCSRANVFYYIYLLALQLVLLYETKSRLKLGEPYLVSYGFILSFLNRVH